MPTSAPNPDTDPNQETVPPVPPKLMRAAVRHRYGTSEALQVAEIDTPTLAPDSPDAVLVQVVSAGLNPFDWHGMTGTPWPVRTGSGLRRPKQPLIGVDMAGRVVAVGAGVTAFEPGDEVCGSVDGALAQLVRTSADNLVAKPANVSFDEAAGIGIPGITALQGLRDKGEVQPGHKVLINGASGGVGTIAVQLAAWMGAEVTAVCSTGNVELVRSLGAEHVIDYTEQDFSVTDQRYDVIFDNQGNRPPGRMAGVLTPSGTYVLVGGPKINRVVGPLGQMARTLIRFRFSGKRARPFIASRSREDLAQLVDLMESGRLRTVVDTVYPLEEIAAAMDQLEAGHVRGKLVVRP